MNLTNNLKNIIRYLYYYKYYSKFSRCGKNVVLSRNGMILKPENISFGDNVFISSGFRISSNDMHFGNEIMIGPNLLVESNDHVYDIVGKTMFETREIKQYGSIVIENDVWIGANVSILKNVIIGEGAIVGACSLVTHDILPYTVSFGIPAAPRKLRFDMSMLCEHLNKVSSVKNAGKLESLYKGCGLL